jgi:hypothetical protein
MTTTTNALVNTQAAPIFMLKGDALVEFVNEKMQLVNRNEMTRTEMILDAGYVNDNGTAAYVQPSTLSYSMQRVSRLPLTLTSKIRSMMTSPLIRRTSMIRSLKCSVISGLTRRLLSSWMN